MDRYMVIVDPLSTGRELAPAFAARGVASIAVFTNLIQPAAWVPAWIPENFEHVLVWNGKPEGIDALASVLRRFDPIGVVPGSEIAVELADQLAARLTPEKANDPNTSIARREKWEMAQAVSAAGIPVLRQIRTSDREEAAAWIKEHGLTDARVVLKPPKSAGTDEVHVVEPGGDWRAAFDAILGRTNALNDTNEAVLVQEFADGVEYLIDLYSIAGVHGLVDVCRYTKATRLDDDEQGRIGIYDRVDFLPPESPEIPGLVDYVKRVADAVGIRNGCGHAEVMLTEDGPRLLEIGARLAGGGHQLVTRLATGDCQVDRTVRHHLDGDFRPDFTWVQHVRAAFLTSNVGGVWRNGDLFDPVDSLPTFHSKHVPYRTGDLIPQTTGLLDAFGWVVLADVDEAAIDADYAKIKELEAALFVD